jgi:peptidyl-prolyl cis-trans isomerase A (cyclophilin A)
MGESSMTRMTLRGAVRMCLLVLGLSIGLAAHAAAQAAAGPVVAIETSLGEIRVALDTAHAPATTANFLRYVDEHFFDDTSFYRTVKPDNQPDNPVKIEVIQGGLDDESGAAYSPIPLERTSVTGLKHLDGTISMARGGPDTGSSEFFICIGDQPELDFGGARNKDGQGFAAFGKVVAGMDVVKKIQLSPADGQRLAPKIAILRVRRVN